ncbi:hypothetical protein MRB53_040947 [Persea americana]|nr:hypothetical protein MRB53_040947 [Persea americana]
MNGRGNAHGTKDVHGITRVPKGIVYGTPLHMWRNPSICQASSSQKAGYQQCAARNPQRLLVPALQTFDRVSVHGRSSSLSIYCLSSTAARVIAGCKPSRSSAPRCHALGFARSSSSIARPRMLDQLRLQDISRLSHTLT